MADIKKTARDIAGGMNIDGCFRDLKHLQFWEGKIHDALAQAQRDAVAEEQRAETLQAED